ncbi:PBECR2 nuclease fold domain-containing protein [Paramuribaculum intestinale]|uniref:PBECR3 domain-containing polyvalent protein n=1 Tax=Paramuribaculum intestinale TaxID=2094151 RepID=UPI00272D11A2|nr:PBECR2 nuclease fold domain-containing protein [Paramuribaculum intestinale]
MSGKTDKRRLSAAEVLSGGEMVKPASMRDIVAMESAMVMPEVTSLPTSGEEMAALMGRAPGADKANKTNGADKANGAPGADPGTRSVDDSEVVDARAEPMRGLYDALRADGCSLPEYGEFRTWMGEEANRRKLYDALRADGCSLPYDYNEFAKAISYQPNIDGMRSAVARGEEAMGDIVALGRHNIESAMWPDRRRGVDPVDVAAPVSGGVGINPSTGLPEQKYLTDSGTVYGKGDATLAAQSDWAAQERQAEQQSIYDEVDSVMVGWDLKNPKASKEERNAMMRQVYDRTVWRRRMDEIDREIAGAERQRYAIADQLRVAWRESPSAQYRRIAMREGHEAADAYMQSVMADGLDAANAKEDAHVRRSGDLSQRLNLANIRLRALRDAKERYERGEEHRESAAPWGTPMGIWQDAKDYTMGFAHGVKNVVTDPLGMVGAFDALATANILDKLERREDLTEDEEALLDATVFSRSTDAFSGSKGIAYQVGEFVPEIAEMAAEFGFSPMSGATRAVCAQGIKRLGIHGFKQLLRHPKFMAKVAGTATLEGASIAATTQAAKNYTEMVGRMVGDPVRDSEGKIRWISGGDSMGEAFAKTAVRAVGSNAVFVLPTNVGGSLLKAMESGEVGKIITKLARSTKYLPWHNPVDALVKMKTSELFSVALGDETWDDYTDKEANAVLLGSVLAAEMTSNGPRAAKAAAQYGSTKYFERRMKGAYFRARSLFEQRGGEKAGEAWDRLTDRLTTLDTESAVNLATALKMMSEGKRAVDGEAEALMRGTTVTTDEAAAFFDFVRAMVGYQSQYCRRRAGGYSWTFEDSTSYNTGGFERDKPQRRIAETATRSFDEGFDAPPSDLDVTRRAAAEARQRVVDQYGEEYASMIDSDPIGFLESRPEDDMSLEMEYINLKARQSGIEARISTTESEAVDAANAEECRRINRQSGMVVRVRVGADEETAREAYVVSGNVSVTADGLPDRSASDGMLVVMDAESGKLEYCSPDRLFSVEEMRAPRLELSEESPELSEAADGEVEADVVDKADVTNEANVSDGGMPSEAHGFKINDTTEVGVLGSDELQSGMVIDVMSDGRLVVWTSQPVDESSVELAEGDGLVGYATEMVPRQQDNVAEADMSEAVSGAESAGGGVEGDMIGRSLSPRESTDLIARMESGAEVAPEVELTPENWISQFGEDGTVETPLGTVKMGDNQYFKLAQQGRDGKLGMVKPTLQRPDIIIEDYRPAANSERDTSFIFVKTFNKSDGSRFYYFTSVTVSKGGREVVISNQEKSGKRISKLLQQGKVAWINNSSLHPNTQVGKPVSLNDSNTPTNSDNEGALLGIDSSADGKVRENAGDMQAGDSALSRIAVDKDGKPMYESAPSDVAWDAIVERAGGDTAIAGEVAAEMVASAREALSAAEQALKEIREGSGSDKANKTAGRGGRKGDKASAQRPMDADDLIAAKLDARAKEAEAMQAVDAARGRLAKWEEIASVASSREMVARAEVEKAEREEAEARAREEARLRAEDEVRQQREREELEGVPDFSIDKPEDARRRGFVRVAGAKIERQQPLPAGHPGYGREVEPMFASGSKPVRAKGRVLITEVDEYQPSHVDGRINPAHMIPEAQPKARHKDGGVSLNTAEQNAKNIDPRLVTRTEDPYTGAPVVNRHREGVQGNGRLQMLRLLYDKFPEKGEVYKQYLIDHAEAFGVDPDYIRSLKRPAMAIEIEGDDARAIELGQMTSQDNESGGIERIRPKHTARKMGDDMGKFAAMLMNDPGDGEASFAELVTQNGAQTLDWMNRNGYISDTQKSSALRADGRLTEDAVKDLKDILYQNIFDGAPTRMEEMFAALPAKAQKAILATAYRDHSSPESERLVPEIQDAITASYMLRSYGLFAEAKNPEACRRAIESWKAQSTIDDLGNVVFPAEIFSNFALELAARFKGDTQRQIQTLLGRILDAVQGRTEDLFAEGPVKPKTVAEAIKEVTGIDYNPQKSKRNGKDVDDRDALLDRGDQNGEVGRPAGGGTSAGGESASAGAGTSERGRGADGVRPESGVRSSEQSEGSESAGGDVDKADKSDGVDGGEPTAAQKEAGNYKKEHRRIDGYRISIENAKGSVRRGTDASGESWEVTMQNDYGYIRGTEGVDGDHIDVFLSDTPEVGDVLVVDQVKPDGTFDEHKVMYGFGSEAEARQAYLSNYSPGWKGLGAITRVSKDEFKKWVNSSKRKTKPFADYHTIKKEVSASSQGSVADYKNIRTEVSARSQGSVAEQKNATTVTDGTGRTPINTNNDDIHVDTIGNRNSSSPFKYFQGTIAELTKLAVESASGLFKKIISPIGERLRKDLASKGLVIDETYNHVIDNNAIRHTLKHHGSKSEEKRGQIPVTEADFAKLDDVVNNYDNIEVEIGKRGIANIKYSRTYDDGTTIFVEEQRVGRKELAAITMWKIKNPTRTDADLNNETPISDLNGDSDGKGSGLFDDLQEGDGEKPSVIEDFGEKIAGARKDMLHDLAKSVENVTVQSLIELPLGKAFKKPNLKKMSESGAISDSDAMLAEAVMQALIFGRKKPTASRRMNSKREISEWAQSTYDGIRFLGEILSGDVSRRDKALADRRAMMADRLAKANAHIENLRQWNPDKQFEYHESLPDEVEVIRNVLERIGYRAGDAVSLPLCRISISSNGKSYEVQSAGKQGAFWFKRYHDTLESAIKTMELAARLKRGDMEAELTARDFIVSGQGNQRMESSGQYEVLYFTKRNQVASKIFDNEADASAFAQSNGGRVREMKRCTNEYDGYQATVVNPLTGNRHPIGEVMPTRGDVSAWLDSNHEEANRQGLEAIYAEIGTKRSSREHFYIGTSYDRDAGKVVYSVIEDDKSNPWPIKKEFSSRNEAEAWLKDNMSRLEEERKIRKEKERQMVYFNPSGDRRGPDHRQGNAATPEMFADTFGFRGVQFGNWTSGADRQAALDQAYDALMDMAGVLGLTPRAMSLDGELGLAFGARGGGAASAHYEPGAVVINLTKTKGVGALAHEWWHALDNYLARHGGVPLGHVTDGNGLDQLRPEVRDAIGVYMQAVDGSEYARRSRDKGDYWGRGTEVAARLFESWIDYKLNGAGEHSPFLASGLNQDVESLYRRLNYMAYRGQERARAESRGVAPQVMSEEEFNSRPESLRGYPYPTKSELAAFDGVVAGVFSALADRENQTGSMAQERRGRYRRMAVGLSLFDAVEESERSEESAAAEQANNAIDAFAASYSEYLERSEELENLKAESDRGDRMTELQEQMDREDALLSEHRALLEESLRDFYVRNNTPEDAAEIARQMVARAQAEVEVRRNSRQILRDIAGGSEQSELSARLEAEPTEVAGGQVKTAGGVISYNALGHLPDPANGEFGLVERQMSLIGEFGFTGNSSVKDRGDVAYIFRALEDYSIEHVFVAFQKGESLKVMHIGMGGPTQSFADLGAIRAGYDAFGADKIYLIHNHPTGKLLASVPDQKLMSTLEAAFPDINTEGIIMDTTSGRYGTFHGTGATESHERPQAGGDSEVGVMRIDRAKRDKDRLPEMPVIRSSADVASYVGGQRLGGGDKVSFLVLANDNRIVANFHTGYGSLGDPGLADELASVATKWGGTSVIVYGNVDVRGASALKSAVTSKSLGGVRLLDAMEITNGLNRSAMDEGYLREGRPAAYGEGEVREPAMSRGLMDFEATRERAVAERGLVMPGLNEAKVRVVDVPRHDFSGDRPIAQAKAWAKANLIGEHHLTDSKGREVEYSISGKSIEKYLSESAISKSDDIGIHLSALQKLPEIIGESVECEIHPSYNKIDGHRLSDNGYNNDLLVHRFYGAIAHEGNVYRVKTTLIEHLDAKTSPHPHAYEVAKIEVLPDYSGNTSIGGAQAYTPTKRGTLQTTKLLKGVEKSYDPRAKLLDESRKEDVRAMIGEQGDPLKDRVLKAALYMAGKDGENMAARDAAVKAIGKRVDSIRKAIRNGMRIRQEYDDATVDALKGLAGAMLESGLLDEMSGGEVKRLLGAMVVSVAKPRAGMRVAADRLLDLMIDNQVRLSKDMLDKALRVKGSKTNAAGVRVGAKLDPMGQQMVKAAREGIEALTEDGVAERIQYLYNEIGEATKAKNDDLKAEYQAMLTGMEIARGYHADVKAKDRAISDLNLELTKLLRTWSDLETKEERDCYRQEKRALEEAIRTLKSEKADGLREVAGAIMGGVGESMERMKAWREAEQARIDHIHHMANADMEGTPISAHERPKLKGMGRLIERTLNSSLGEFLLGPTATFEQMMRLFASHSIDGRGYVYERFIPGWMECNDRRWKNQRAQEERLNAKAKEVAGVKRWSGLYDIGRQPAGKLRWRDGGEMKEFVITQDNLMYVYMANKMEDGIMKLRGMGISEEVMEEVVKRLDPRLKKLADWVQEEFLPSNKGRYNDVHKRMFNAPMAEVENYFPLKVLADARQQDMDIKEGATGSVTLPRTMTGAIVERTKNSLPLDILNSSAISIVLDNLREMEEWAAFAEYRRDVGTLLSYTRFRNQVKNTKSIYGSGDNLWNKMVKLALITCGAYERKQSDLDKAAVNLAKGVTGACIAFRLNTALKQLLSLPAFASEANAIRLLAALNPIKSWRWSMENLPSLQERWISRQAGNELLKVCKDDWSIYDKKWIKAIGRAGISPNAFIDAVTVAIGSKAVYESKYNEYVKAGWSAEVSRKKAILDAEIAFNLSQQSSLAPFMSIMQSDRTLGSTMLTIFRNSPMSYLRQQVQATREINNYIRDHGQMDYEVKKLQREGLPEEKAKAYANKKRKRVIAKNLFRLLNFGFILPGLWAMGGAMWYLMAGDDKEQKQEILEDAAIRGLYGTLDGVTLGGMIPDMIFNYFHKDEPSRLRDTSLLPFEQEASGAVDALTGNNPWKGVHKTINLLSQMFSGGNPQLVEDWVVAGMDFFGADEKNGEEWALLGMRIFQVPQSQLDMIYLDKLGLWSDEARKEPPAKLARRWAHYKATRSNITGALAMSAEKWAEEEEKQRKRFNKMAKELLEGADKSGYREKFEAYNDEYMRIDAEYKDLMSKRKRGDVDRSAIYDRLRELKSTDEYKRYERFAKLKGAYDSSVDRWLDAATPEATLEALEYHETTKRLLVEIMDNKNLDSVMEAAAELADMERRQKRRDLGWDD